MAIQGLIWDFPPIRYNGREVKYVDKRVVESENVPWFIEWLWAPLWVVVAWLFERFFNMNRRVTQLEMLGEQREKDHAETMDALKNHGSDVTEQIKDLKSDMTEQLRGYGHRLGTIESHLINRGKD